MPCHGLACANKQSSLASCTLHVQFGVRPYLNWYRQEGDEQQVLSVGDQAIIIDIKHLEEVAVLQQQHKGVLHIRQWQVASQKFRHLWMNSTA